MSGATSLPLVILAAGRAERFGSCKPLADVGPAGEAIIDLVASDAIDAGFTSIVVVVSPTTGPLIRDHISASWPRGVTVDFVEQTTPSGTVDAVLSAREAIPRDSPFAVANADDVYGPDALHLLVDRLGRAAHGWAPERDDHLLVAFRLHKTLSSADPVTRGICDVGTNGRLVRLTERRNITMDEPRHEVTSRDGLAPVLLDPDAWASMNLWGFQPGIWELFDRAASTRRAPAAGPDPREASGRRSELLLPEVVGAVVAEPTAHWPTVAVVFADGRCISVTHAADVVGARRALEALTASGARHASLFDGVRLEGNIAGSGGELGLGAPTLAFDEVSATR